jgi:sulfite exporter TauE/SafE
MTGGVVLSAALMGLAGAAHCGAMCAAPCGLACHAVGGEGGRRQALWALVGGRLVGYALAGAVAAALVSSLQWWAAGAAWLGPVWTLLQVAMMALGFYLLLTGHLPRRFDAWAERTLRRRREPALKGIPVVARGAALGVGWVAVPCGLLHGALLVSALASSPAEGALAMGAFAVTSSAGLLLGPRLWWRAVANTAPATADGAPVPPGAGTVAPAGAWIEPATALRLAGATLIASASFTLLMRVWEPFLAWCTT